MLLDLNGDRSVQTSSKKTKENDDLEFSRKILNFDTSVEGLQATSSKVQINTLSPYIHVGGGTFTMTLVKKMTGKPDFLDMPPEKRECEVELYDDCRTRKLIRECNCVPWELPGFQVCITK